MLHRRGGTMGISLIVLDADTAYRSKLKDWLLVHPECGFSLMDSSEEGLPMARNDATLILKAAGAAMPVSCQRPDLHVIHLQDGTTVQAPEDLPPVSEPVINKYQPVPSLLQAVLHLAEARGWTRPRVVDPGRCRLTLVIHVGGGGHLQPIVPILAALCAKCANTAVLSLDPVLPLECWYPATSGGGLSRLAYEVRGREPLSVRSLDACLTHDAATGVHVIRTAELPQDAAGFDVTGMTQLKRACGEANLDLLLADAGAGLTDRNLDLLGIAEQIFLVGSGDTHGLRCMESAISLCRQLGVSGRNLFDSGSSTRWLLMGKTSPEILQPVPDKHLLMPFPVAYPEGFSPDPWEVSDVFLRAVHALVPACRKAVS